MPNLDSAEILVVRADRLGDVILSTPVFEAIKRTYPNSRLTVLARDSVIPILRGLSCIDDLLVYEPEGRHAGWKGWVHLIEELRARSFDWAIVLQTHWKLAAAVFFAGIHSRVGPLSQFSSYLFFNRGMRQRRSRVEMHEADYNLQLLKRLGIQVESRGIPTQIAVSRQEKDEAFEWLKKRGWNSKRPLILVHPGMGGSALNWPTENYRDLVKKLADEGHQVVVTGGPTEHGLLDSMEHDLDGRVIFYRAPQGSSVTALAALCSHASVVVAPSTGPLHLAVAVGRPVVTFYPPIRVQSAFRWGPYSDRTSGDTVLTPEVVCGEAFKCRGRLCSHYPCMSRIRVNQVFNHVNRVIQHCGDIEHHESLESPSV